VTAGNLSRDGVPMMLKVGAAAVCNISQNDVPLISWWEMQPFENLSRDDVPMIVRPEDATVRGRALCPISISMWHPDPATIPCLCTTPPPIFFLGQPLLSRLGGPTKSPLIVASHV
jgi:hypothetical protein